MKERLEKNFNLKNIIKSLVVIYIFYNSTIFNLIPIYLCKLDINTISTATSIYIMLFSHIVILLIFLGIYFKDIINEFKKFINKIWENFDIGLKSWLLGLGIMFVSNFILIFIFKSSGANNENAVQSLIDISPVAMGFYSCLLAPIVEEIVFRKTLKDSIKNKWLFIITSFLFFGGAHVVSSANNIIDLLYIVPYGAFGATFAYAYYKTDTIYTSIIFHIIHNSLLFFLSFFV